MGKPTAIAMYELVGFVALALTAILIITLVLFLGMVIWEAMTPADHIGGGHLWLTALIVSIPPLLSSAALVATAYFCRQRARALSQTAELSEHSDGQLGPPQQATAFAVMAGILGVFLVLESCFRLIDQGGDRWRLGLALHEQHIPFMQFIDIGLYAALGLLLFLRPHLPYALWRRFAQSPEAKR